MSDVRKSLVRGRKPSAFALAREVSTITAEIDVEDVLATRPEWTPQQAAEFIRTNAKEIAAAMVECGVELLISLSTKGQHAN
jgi:hypothetical protein